MIVNCKCDECYFQTKCLVYKKLAPFSESARTDLGVELEFISCNDYRPADEENEEDNKN